jgi:hypothetical protein
MENLDGVLFVEKKQIITVKFIEFQYVVMYANKKILSKHNNVKKFKKKMPDLK